MINMEELQRFTAQVGTGFNRITISCAHWEPGYYGRLETSHQKSHVKFSKSNAGGEEDAIAKNNLSVLHRRL